MYTVQKDTMSLEIVGGDKQHCIGGVQRQVC